MADVEVQERSWDRCIDRLYDAVGHEHRLAAALGDFRPFFAAQGVTFLTLVDQQNPQSTHTASIGVSEQSMVEYHAHFHAYDEWVLAARRRSDFGLGAIYPGSKLVPRNELRQTYFWKHFLSRYGVTDSLSAIVDATAVGEPTAFLTMHRHEGQPPFSSSQARLMAHLAPHLRQVLRLHRRLAPALALGSTIGELVQRLELPVLFLAADGRVVDRNPAAERALTDEQGWLQMNLDRLWSCVEGHWSPVQQVLGELPRSGSIGLDLSTADQRCATLDLRLVHGAATDRAADHEVLAVCTLNVGPRDRLQALRKLYGLTAAEARVALRIAEGHSLAAIAAESELAIATVRTQVAAVRQKLGVSRQAQIVARVLAL